MQEMKPTYFRFARVFADWALERMKKDPEFSNRILFSDDAHFWLNGNCHYIPRIPWFSLVYEQVESVRIFSKTDYLLSEIEARNVGDIWFQQDGASWHTVLSTMSCLRPDGVISYRWTFFLGLRNVKSFCWQTNIDWAIGNKYSTCNSIDSDWNAWTSHQKLEGADCLFKT